MCLIDPSRGHGGSLCEITHTNGIPHRLFCRRKALVAPMKFPQALRKVFREATMCKHIRGNSLSAGSLALATVTALGTLCAGSQPAVGASVPPVGTGVCGNCMKPPPPPPPLRPLPPPPVSYGNGGGGVTYSRSYPAPRPRLSPSGQVNDQGNALFAARDYEGAIEKYRQALRINPANQVARTNLAGARARLAAKHKDYARALSYQREACRLKPNKFYCVPILSYQAHL